MRKHNKEITEKKNKLSIVTIIGFVCMFVSIISFIISIMISEKVGNYLEEFEVISDETSLREALDKEPQKYRLINMVVTGEACNDPLGILESEFVCLEYTKYIYVRRTTSDSNTEKEWDPQLKTKEKSRADELYLFNDIKLEKVDYSVSMEIVKDLHNEVKSRYTDKVSLSEYDEYFYPQKIGDILKNERYLLRGIKKNSNIAFLAEVGNGKITPVGYKGKKPVIIGNGDLSDIEYEADEAAGAFGALWLFTLICAIGIFGYKLICKIIEKIKTPATK